MGDLFAKVKKYSTLEKAWRHVRGRGLRSASSEIRAEVREFDLSPGKNLKSLLHRLAGHTFKFSPQLGVAKKRKGKSARPIVVSPIENRIVQRAILDVLSEAPAIREVLDIPTSVGGIEGVDRAIALAVEAMRNGAKWYIRSDIPGFFTKIPKARIMEFIRSIPEADEHFIKLFEAAMAVDLANAETLGKDALLFPTDEEGVAQGSALSPLIGNILLRDFDLALNGRGITCIRYIDDFLILGPSRKAVVRAFEHAKEMLAEYGMDAYDPASHPEKSAIGEVRSGFDFLGCHIQPGMVMPSKAARAKLLDKVRMICRDGKRAMKSARDEGIPRGQRYAQTLTLLDRTIKGWGDSFAFCNAKEVFKMLDKKIDNEINEFRTFANRLSRKQRPLVQRRILGIHALEDTKITPVQTQ